MSERTVDAFAELAIVRRSGIVESRHFGSLLAFNPDGTVAIELGSPDDEVLPRSTVKPLQAMACVIAGAELFGPELAIASGSHTGEDAHVAVVNSILQRAGLDEHALDCPIDRPEDEVTFERMIREGEGRNRLRMNCSGKHAAMILACSVNGWSTDDYLDAAHPLQQQVLETMAEMTGVPVSHTAIDGCGAPLFGTSVRGVAASFRSLVLAEQDSVAGRVAAAMRENPFYVGGSRHANSELMVRMPGALAKGGAEGVIGVASSDGASVSMKIIDGSPRATTVIALAVLESLGYDTRAAAAFAKVPVFGGGQSVGQIEVGADLRHAMAIGRA